MANQEHPFLFRLILNLIALRAFRLRLDRDAKGAPFGLIQFKELGIARGCCHLTEAAPVLFRSFGSSSKLEVFPSPELVRALLLMSRGVEQKLVSNPILPTELLQDI